LPLQTQLLATDEQKRIAYMSFEKGRHQFVGYATKAGAPIYLLGSDAYPLETVESGDGWNTFLWLPQVLVSDDDVGVANKAIPCYDVPLDSNFFLQNIGPELLVKKENGSTITMPTADALNNTRLVAFYFSAHWCGRKF
jgi:hypothetical protein